MNVHDRWLATHASTFTKLRPHPWDTLALVVLLQACFALYQTQSAHNYDNKCRHTDRCSEGTVINNKQVSEKAGTLGGKNTHRNQER